jgi:hypothetical protein
MMAGMVLRGLAHWQPVVAPHMRNDLEVFAQAPSIEYHEHRQNFFKTADLALVA